MPDAETSTPTPTWVDTDAGFDDLAAIIVALATPALAVQGISLVAGNSDLDRVVANASAMKQIFGWQVPLYRGRAAPLAQSLVTAEAVLGPRGMRSAGRELPDGADACEPQAAVDRLAAFVEASTVSPLLIALGPLGNIADFVTARPDLVPRIGCLALMGGSFSRGNHTAVAEFNIAADPEAASIVFTSGIAIRMFGLDVCRRVRVTGADAQAVRAAGTERAELLADLYEAYAATVSADGQPGMPLYDPLVSAWAALPAAFRFAPARVDIELDGRYTRGMTVTEFRVPGRALPNAEVAVDADAAAVRAHVAAALLAACTDSPAP